MNTKKFFSNETVIRMVSLLIAVILWMYVVSVKNPQITTTVRNVPIQITNIENVENNGLEIISMSDDKIDVRISGRMFDVSDVTVEDILVQLDVSNVYSANNYYITPDIKLSANGVSVVSTSVDSVNVYVDYISRVEKDIIIETVGEADKGFRVSEVYSANNKVIVSGPQSIINRIEKVKAVVDISGASEDLNKVCQVKLYSSNNEEIVSDKIKLSVTDISVTVKFGYSQMLPVVLDLQNIQTTEDFSVEAYNLNPSVYEIEVHGERAHIKEISQITAVVEPVPTDDEEQLLANEWKATLVIPEGITVKDSVTEITVKFEKK